MNNVILAIILGLLFLGIGELIINPINVWIFQKKFKKLNPYKKLIGAIKVFFVGVFFFLMINKTNNIIILSSTGGLLIGLSSTSTTFFIKNLYTKIRNNLKEKNN